MLFVLTGSSAAGKSAVLPRLAARVEDLEPHDFDELGVRRGASSRWRQEATEEWTRRVLASSPDGRDTLIACQSPIGEWLSVPSATDLDGIAVCLLDVSDRIVRSASGGVRPGSRSGDTELAPLLAWAAWHRSHAADPRSRQDVIRKGAWERMRWERWEHWERGDRRWDVVMLDTSDEPVDGTVEQLAGWIAERRCAHREGTLGLSGCWWTRSADRSDYVRASFQRPSSSTMRTGSAPRSSSSTP